jgi:hypothetical protein
MEHTPRLTMSRPRRSVSVGGVALNVDKFPNTSVNCASSGFLGRHSKKIICSTRSADPRDSAVRDPTPQSSRRLIRRPHLWHAVRRAELREHLGVHLGLDLAAPIARVRVGLHTANVPRAQNHFRNGPRRRRRLQHDQGRERPTTSRTPATAPPTSGNPPPRAPRSPQRAYAHQPPIVLITTRAR